jgi:hypothetical protein
MPGSVALLAAQLPCVALPQFHRFWYRNATNSIIGRRYLREKKKQGGTGVNQYQIKESAKDGNTKITTNGMDTEYIIRRLKRDVIFQC